MFSRKISKVVLLSLGLISVNGVASPYTPTDKNQVIASLERSNAPQDLTLLGIQHDDPLHIANTLLQKITLPGNSAKYLQTIETALERASLKYSTTSEYLYLKARLQQHKHEFESALNTLKKVHQIDPYNGNAWLLSASIHSLLGRHAEAQDACKKTYGLMDFNYSALCQLDISAQQGKADEAYSSISNLYQQPGKLSEDVKDWAITLAAEQAFQLNKIDEAKTWLAKIDLSAAPLSTLLLWSDVYLSQSEGEQVLSTMEPLVKDIPHIFISDALLVRLAMAEKQAAQMGKSPSNNNVWQVKAANRIELRLAREDVLHAAELARFFIYLSPNKDKARYWSEFNYEKHQGFDDKRLKLASVQMEVK